MEHIRSSRAMVKVTKQRQRLERQEFVTMMRNLERMVFRHYLLMEKDLTCEQWLENGVC
jgi:hypothetical protein